MKRKPQIQFKRINLRKIVTLATTMLALLTVLLGSFGAPAQRDFHATGDGGTCPPQPPAPRHYCGRDEYGRCEEQIANCHGAVVNSWGNFTYCCYSIGFGEYSICWGYRGEWTCCRPDWDAPPTWLSECKLINYDIGMTCDSDGRCWRLR